MVHTAALLRLGKHAFWLNPSWLRRKLQAGGLMGRKPQDPPRSGRVVAEVEGQSRPAPSPQQLQRRVRARALPRHRHKKEKTASTNWRRRPCGSLAIAQVAADSLQSAMQQSRRAGQSLRRRAVTAARGAPPRRAGVPRGRQPQLAEAAARRAEVRPLPLLRARGGARLERRGRPPRGGRPCALPEQVRGGDLHGGRQLVLDLRQAHARTGAWDRPSLAAAVPSAPPT
uniref:Uncharacterized protein n=1 Tax=Alexandrium monilatum TaxID=311494 RepID=A0A7S4QJM7_9DINO